MTIKGRILTFIKEQGISREEFYKRTGLSASNFKGVALKSALGSDKIAKILTIYNMLSPEWLLMGNGSMLKQNVSNEQNVDNTFVSNGKDTANNSINQEETHYIYKMYQEEREEKRRMLKEKDDKIDQLQSELLAAKEELATLKAQHSDFLANEHAVLGDVKSASTKKYSSVPYQHATYVHALSDADFEEVK